MSSYRGAWDGGPPGAEGEYAPPPPAPAQLPATDPWTGVSYSQYGAYDYSAYGAAAYSYGYDPSYYQQRPDGTYFVKYPEAGAVAASAVAASAYPPPPPAYEYPAPRPASRSRSPDSRGRHSPVSKSRSASPYNRRERSYSRERKRDGSYESSRRRRSRSSSHRKKYFSSDRSVSRSRSYSRSPSKKDRKKRSISSGSSASNKSYKKRTGTSKRSDHSLTPPPKVKMYRSRKRSESPGTPDSGGRRSVSKSKNVKSHSSKEKQGKDKRRDMTTPPRKKKVCTPPRGKKSDRSSLSPPRSYKINDRDSSLTPPRTYKFKDRNSDTPPRKARDRSVTPPKSYARSISSTSKSGSEPPAARSRRKKTRGGRRTPSPSSSSASSHSSSRSRSKSKRKARRKAASKQRSRSKSRSRSSSNPRRRSKSKTMKRSASPEGSKSRSPSGTPSDGEQRRGQFTVSDRKRFWKQHRSRQVERSKEARTPPREVKPPPGAVESTKVDDIQYGDPPDVVGPNFAELLPPPDITALAVAAASTSRSKPVPIPIKNDGSFLEMFKKMQEATKKVEDEKKPEIKKPVLPFIGKRRGGRVLKTGLVKKAKAIDEQTVDNAPKDAWSLYMQEVKKYRETSCEEERKTRPLVK